MARMMEFIIAFNAIGMAKVNEDMLQMEESMNSVTRSTQKLGEAQEKLKNIESISQKFRESASNYDTALQSIKTLEKEYTELNKVAQTSSEKAENLRKIQAKLAEIDKLESSLTKLTNEYNENSEALKKLKEEQEKVRIENENYSREIEKTKTRISSINDSTKDGVKLKKEEQEKLKTLKEEYRKSSEKIDDYNKKIKKLETYLEKVNNQKEKQKNSFENVKNAIEKEGRELEEYKKRLEDVNKELKNYEKYKKSLEKVNNYTKSGEEFYKAGKNQFTRGIKTLGALAVPLKLYAELEEAQADLKKAVDFDSLEEQKELFQKIRELKSRTSLKQTEVFEIAGAAAQSGIVKEELADYTEKAIQVKVAFDISTEEAGDFLAKTKSQFQLAKDEEIFREWRKWRLAGGRVLAGLIKRRNAEIQLFKGEV